jgi:methylmalonyl-CoA/ethylmalonyl-CoA epimerase
MVQESGGNSMLFESLNRVGVAVYDIDQAIADFQDLFGAEFYGPFDDPDVGIKVTTPKHLGLEFVSPQRPDDKIGTTKILEQFGEGLTAVCWKVSDIEEAEKRLIEAGLTPMTKMQHGPMKETVFMPCKKSHGLTIVINEFPDTNGLGMESARYFGAEL